MDKNNPFEKPVSKDEFNGFWIPHHNAKVFKRGLEENKAPFLPDATGTIKAEPIYNAASGYCLPAGRLIPVQFAKMENNYNSNIVIPRSTVTALENSIKENEKGVFYNFIQLSFFCNSVGFRSVSNVFVNAHGKRIGLLKNHTHTFAQKIDIHIAVDIFANLPSSVFNVALYHKAFNQLFDGGIVAAAVHNLFGNTNLLKIFFPGVGVVGIHNHSRIFKTRKQFSNVFC